MSKLEEWNLEGRGKLLACLLLFFASVLLYSPALKFEFTKYDDSSFIGEHPQLYATGSVADRLSQIILKDFPREEPLIVRDLSWLADSLLFGFYRPFGYHYSNVIYHALTLVLAFLLLLRMTNPATALISSLLLLVLAAHVEPVAWIMGRKDILSAMFSILSLLVFWQLQHARSIRKKALVYAGSLFFALAAILSKINAVVLPGIIFLCSLLQEKELMRAGFGAPNLLRILGRRFVQVLPLLLLSIAAYAWYMWVLADFGILEGVVDYSGDDIRRLVFLVNPLVLFEYLRIILVPWNLEAFYTEPSVFTPFSAGDVALAITVVTLLMASLVALWRYNRPSCLLLLCFLVAMLPYANWANFGFWYANRYVYFSSIFLLASVVNASVALEAKAGLRPAKALAATAFMIVLGQNLFYRAGYLDVWKNGETLWRHEISIPGASLHDYNALVAYYIGRAEDEIGPWREPWLEKAEAVDEQIWALEVPPYDLVWVSVAHYHKGLILTYTSAPLEEQLAEYSKAVELSKGYYMAIRGVASTYLHMARQETDSEKRIELARKSWSYFLEAFSYAQNDTRAQTYVQQIVSLFRRDFPELPLDYGEADARP